MVGVTTILKSAVVGRIVPTAHPIAWMMRDPMSTPMLLASAATIYPTIAIAKETT